MKLIHPKETLRVNPRSRRASSVDNDGGPPRKELRLDNVSCEICGRSFGKLSSLKTHLYLSHPDSEYRAQRDREKEAKLVAREEGESKQGAKTQRNSVPRRSSAPVPTRGDRDRDSHTRQGLQWDSVPLRDLARFRSRRAGTPHPNKSHPMSGRVNPPEDGSSQQQQQPPQNHPGHPLPSHGSPLSHHMSQGADPGGPPMQIQGIPPSPQGHGGTPSPVGSIPPHSPSGHPGGPMTPHGPIQHSQPQEHGEDEPEAEPQMMDPTITTQYSDALEREGTFRNL